MKLPKSTIYLLGAIAFGLVSAVLIAMTVLSIKYELPAKSILIRIFASSMFLILFFMRLNRYTYYRNIEKRGVPEPRVLPKPLPAAYKAPWTPSVPWIFIPISYALVGISLVGLVFYFLGYHPGWTILHASKLVKPGGPEIPMYVRFESERTLWGFMYLIGGTLTVLAKDRKNVQKIPIVFNEAFKYAILTGIVIEIINIIAIPFKYHTATTTLAYSSFFLNYIIIYNVLLKRYKKKLEIERLTPEKVTVESLYPERRQKN